MISGELGVDALVQFAIRGIAGVQRLEAAVDRRQFLFHDVGFDGDAEMIRLPGDVGCGLIVGSVDLETGVAGVAPQHRRHAQFMSTVECFCDFDQLARAFFRTEVDGRANSNRAHIPCLFDLTEHDLIMFVGIGQQFVVVDFDEEGDFVGILPRHRTEHAKSGSHRIAPALNRQFDDLFGIEINRIFGERRATGMLDTLIDR